MKESITQVTKKNVVIRDWSLRTQKVKGDTLKEGYIPNLPNSTSSRYLEEDKSVCFDHLRTDRLLEGSRNLCAEDITWRAPWIRPSVLLYKCGNQDWVPLLGLWEGVGYAPLMVQRQFVSRQFIPATDGVAQSEFAFTGKGYMKKVRDTANSWREIYLMELALYADTITLDYDIWRQRRVKNQLTPPTDYAFQNLLSEEMLSELEMARHEFEREKFKLLRDISSL
ncbi:hypothetical protein Gotur_004856 [Gossypium turneri]